MKYLGLHETPQKNPGTISLLKRGPTGNPITEAHDEDIILQALVLLNLTDHNLDQYSLRRGGAVTTRQQELVHCGEWVKYLDSESNVNNITNI